MNIQLEIRKKKTITDRVFRDYRQTKTFCCHNKKIH